MADLPSGAVTFLFTDIEGSTRLWEAHPDAMRAALLRHDSLLRSAIELHGGCIFKTVGDAFCAAFASAARAVDAALAGQRGLRTEPWSDEAPIRVRMALYTGAAEERDGDYFGPAVNRVARLLGIAHGNQVVLAAATADVLAGCLPDDAGLQDLAAHRLRDLQEPLHVFQLLHPALPDEFPPLRSLQAFANNLPVQLSSFIGREQELSELRGLLTSSSQPGSARLITLTGAGGVGKSRLALQAAAEVLEEYPDGVWRVELAALSDPALLPQAVASALGLREEPGRALPQTLAEHLRARHLLLVLDNCEHLIAACADLAQWLLGDSPGIRLLATSREALRIEGETAYRVPSLSLPESGALPGEALRHSEAVRLFVARAGAAAPSFRLTVRTLPAVAQVCRRLDGIPMAIELAAARVRALPVERLAERLEDRFRLLTGGSRTALPRHQTLRALIDWSYDLLNDQEQALLARLSVFAGGWALEAAEAVCGGSGLGDPVLTPGPSPTTTWRGGTEPATPPCRAMPGRESPPGREELPRAVPPVTPLQVVVGEGPGVRTATQSTIRNEEVLDLLTSLVDKSLVLFEEPDQEEARYRLLETVRQYAGERLAESGVARELRSRHAAFCLALAEAAEPELTGAQQSVWLGRLDREHDNLRAALDWGLGVGVMERGSSGVMESWSGGVRGMPDRRDPTTPPLQRSSTPAGRGLRLAGALWRFWFVRGYLAEGRRWLDLSLARGDGGGDLRAKALNGAGVLAWQQGDYAAAEPLYEESLAIRRELGDPGGIAASLNNLGNLARRRGDASRAWTLHQECLVIHRQLGDRHRIATSLNNLGALAYDRDDYRSARALHEEGLSLRRELGDQWGIALSLVNLAEVACRETDYQAAREWLGESLTLCGSLDLKQLAPHALEAAARLAHAVQPPERVARLLGAAGALEETIAFALTPEGRKESDRCAEECRAALGEPAFAAAFAAGRAMDWRQAVEYALEATTVA